MKELGFAAVAHCILNQATRWWNEEKGAAPLQGSIWRIVKRLDDLGVGVYQLPCPEITFLGNPRPSLTRGDYEGLMGYLEHIRRLSSMACSEMEALIDMSREPRLRLVGLVGLARSPSCAAGEGSGPSSKPGGIFFEELVKELRRRGLEAKAVEIDLRELDATLSRLDELAFK